MYTRIVADALNSHECGIDCVPTADGRHILFPALPTIDAGRYQWELNRGMTRAEYRASGQDETRECRVWARARAERLELERAQDRSRAAWGLIPQPRPLSRSEFANLDLYYSGRESSSDEGRGL